MANNVTPRNGSYQANIMLAGTRYRYTFRTEAEALTWVSQAKLAHQLGKYIPQPVTLSQKGGSIPHTLGELLRITARDHWAQLKASKSLTRNGELFTEWMGANYPIADITSGDLYGYADYLRTSQGNDNSTINRKVSAAKVMLRKAVRSGWISSMPYIEKFKENSTGSASDFLDFGEEDPIINHLKHNGLEDLADLVVFLIDTGARINEALTLPAENVAHNRVRFENTKNGSFRTIPLTTRAQAAVARRTVNTKTVGRPFGDIRYNYAIKRLRAVYDQLGGRYAKVAQPFHIFRHSCASRLAIKGVDARRIQEWLDHSSLVVTQRYMKLSSGALDQVVSALEPEETTTHLRRVS